MNLVDEDEQVFRDPPLTPLDPRPLLPEPVPTSPSPQLRAQRPRPGAYDPGNAVLVGILGPNNPELALPPHDPFSTSLEEAASDRSSITTSSTDRMEIAQADAGASVIGGPATCVGTPTVQTREAGAPTDSVNAVLAAKALEASEAVAGADSTAVAPGTSRIDHRHGGASPPVPDGPVSRTMAKSPLKIETSSRLDATHAVVAGDTIATSPTLRKHAIPVVEGTTNTLPAVQAVASPARSGAVVSPQNDRLPSIRQLTGQLGDLAEAAAIQDARAPTYVRHHSQSLGSATSSSPQLPYHTYSGSAQTSPVSHYGYPVRSPTSTIGENPQYGSPTRYTPAAYFAGRRRSSTATEGPVSFPPSMPSTSSSGESHGPAGSSTDGYSTTHTTPIEPPPPDGAARPAPPPPMGMPMGPAMLQGNFKCDFPGCHAASFQTQYLLSSHQTVHSQNRPHYCPMKHCPRSEGGKGFKRKNEMIRHGLVHNSPGYICPFCPDREHRYPRPDNLQRHVRVHHMDKDRDDPALRDVLAQRTEGAGKSRRRRTNAGVAGGPE